MNHRKRLKKLNRTSSHRQCLLANMAMNVIKHRRIITTVAKAKALRPYLEKLVTRAREASLHDRRLLLKKLKHYDLVRSLVDDIAPNYVDRNGGYTRILKLSVARPGDKADRAMIEFV
ncbi:MAG: ribosomal protein L17 [Candidatus Xenolissoclinum pacificiensis L6]|uniref:Large ribosomal subunit protein bL17 n=1 Tax=Candidatus Xenolissoclinum pacificiensis L6 TaxID=1401685 RepID=W2UYV9_9RICK|nr:MAG: ribosomal protein L17 [Candidatus Xenolissoclinum pacificiensis L6]